jgi:hypothetical protein
MLTTLLLPHFRNDIIQLADNINANWNIVNGAAQAINAHATYMFWTDIACFDGHNVLTTPLAVVL